MKPAAHVTARTSTRYRFDIRRRNILWALKILKVGGVRKLPKPEAVAGFEIRAILYPRGKPQRAYTLPIGPYPWRR